ncbi:hypothetical protein ABID21_003917 [Pseudorhizobium tarimense]|uniref:Uncharacterized protein n=1 Tax=Pseudorhizobium tarimense TaxID=1079109 RepID=A0ABV2HB78_9HYPH|nr:hypothetical protein [Pseudorhizobium tarimense]MCJ8520697.1 hypothetical protein [Pseudorhizobium tarimense]
MTRTAAAYAHEHNPVFADDIQRTAWAIAARHLTAGQKDVTKMIADGIRQERSRCTDLVHAALGPDAEIAVFVANPSHDW